MEASLFNKRIDSWFLPLSSCVKSLLHSKAQAIDWEFVLNGYLGLLDIKCDKGKVN